jgi:hypothetical protein
MLEQKRPARYQPSGAFLLSRSKNVARRAALLRHFRNDYFSHHVACAEFVDHVQPVHHFAEDGVVAVEMRRVLPRVTNEELRTAGVAPCVRHRQHAPVVVLVFAVEFALDLIARPAGASAGRVAALHDEVWNHAVELNAVVKARFRELYKVSDRVRGVFFKKIYGHHALGGMNLNLLLHGGKSAFGGKISRFWPHEGSTQPPCPRATGLKE